MQVGGATELVGGVYVTVYDFSVAVNSKVHVLNFNNVNTFRLRKVSLVI